MLGIIMLLYTKVCAKDFHFQYSNAVSEVDQLQKQDTVLIYLFY